MGTLLFVLKYMYISFASEDDKWVFLPAKIMASPFKPLTMLYFNENRYNIHGILFQGAQIQKHVEGPSISLLRNR